MRFALGLILALLMVEAALAQDTIGDLLAAGGKRLTKDEALAVLRRATISGPTAAGGQSLAELKENGTTSGYLTNATRARGAIFGTWSVDDAGNFCRDIELRFRETRQIKDCSTLSL
ncbi:MAG TPA: hypothetical protein VMM27_02320 [Casimicrobiaceae bacterium]|nr:hypothetical protein [Casimicrobiaceae bacterium]HTS20518.1 hypothetical protein [Casimicrobiaceae bacterium]